MSGLTMMLAALSCSPMAELSDQQATEAGTDVNLVAQDAWVVEDFSTYSTLDEYLKTTKDGRYRTSGNNNQQVSLDPDNALGEIPHSLRYDFPDRTNEPRRCNGYTISREFHFPERRKEIWVEAWLKFSENFNTEAPEQWGCQSNPDLKLLFGLVNAAGGSGRFQIKTGTFGTKWVSTGPGSQANKNFADSSPFWDGQWHQLRTHWRAGSDGAIQVWLDGVLYQDTTNLDFGVPDIYGLKLGANMNQGPGEEMSYWWGRIQVWDKQPKDW